LRETEPFKPRAAKTDVRHEACRGAAGIAVTNFSCRRATPTARNSRGARTRGGKIGAGRLTGMLSRGGARRLRVMR
jgi:hypothetical protein